MATKVSKGRRQRILDIIIIVDTQMWSLEDLKNMLDTLLMLYYIAI